MHGGTGEKSERDRWNKNYPEEEDETRLENKEEWEHDIYILSLCRPTPP